MCRHTMNWQHTGLPRQIFENGAWNKMLQVLRFLYFWKELQLERGLKVTFLELNLDPSPSKGS